MNLSYEEALQELQGILQELQDGKTNIDELAAKAKRAKALITYCRAKLRETEEELGGLFEP